MVPLNSGQYEAWQRGHFSCGLPLNRQTKAGFWEFKEKYVVHTCHPSNREKPWYQNFWILTNWAPANMAAKKKKKTKKIDICDFPVYDCTQEQNSSPYFSCIIWKCKWPSPSTKTVEIQTFCYHGSVMSHPSLYRCWPEPQPFQCFNSLT